MDPVRDPDADARAMARDLIDTATFAALATTRPEGGPTLSRIALTTDDTGAPLSLISSLSAHTQALDAEPQCALLIGEPAERGDPLTHPRLTLHCHAVRVPRDAPAHDGLRARYLAQRPKAKLYIDFADFQFVTFMVQDGMLNGGFGKAFRIARADLAL
ncbi:MAG: pyridoxamine 5'-phosphate oxidase family protein [Pseudomonadota bacterium]